VPLKENESFARRVVTSAVILAVFDALVRAKVGKQRQGKRSKEPAFGPFPLQQLMEGEKPIFPHSEAAKGAQSGNDGSVLPLRMSTCTLSGRPLEEVFEIIQVQIVVKALVADIVCKRRCKVCRLHDA
jgi:hypothetical protein